jgi:Ca2+-transporting ATPase
VHIVFMELIIDPACSIVFEAEPEEKDIMRRPPRDAKEPLLGRRTVVLSILQGLSVLAVSTFVFVFARNLGHSENAARALAFTTLVIANLGLIFTNRSWSRTFFATIRVPNPAAWWSSAGAVVFLGLVLYVPLLQRLFRFETPSTDDLVMCLAAGVLSVMWFEAIKVVDGWRKKAMARRPALR